MVVKKEEAVGGKLTEGWIEYNKEVLGTTKFSVRDGSGEGKGTGGNDTVGRRRRDDEGSEVKATTATLAFQYNIKKKVQEVGGKETEKRGKIDTYKQKQIFTCISEQNPQPVLLQCFVITETQRKNEPLSKNSAVWRHITEICSEAFRN